MGYPEAELSLVLVDDPAIRELNRRYLGRDKPTNVISFPQEDDGLGSAMLGDVVISIDTATREAELAGQELEWALDRLIIHGLLHLVGYDHEAPGSDGEAMAARHKELMAKLGWPV